MERIRRLGKVLHQVYIGIGIAAMGGVAALVIFTVIARYFFSLSWKGLDEFMNALFAFTTFWGLGIAVLEGEHVSIDILYRLFKPKAQRFISLANLLISLAVVVIVCAYSFQYIAKVGGHPSPGMSVPMKYLYGVMPVSLILCAICIILKAVPLAMGHTPPVPGSQSAVPEQPEQ